MWLNMASIQGDKDAAEDKRRVEKKMSTLQIEKAKEMAENQNLKISNPTHPKPCTHQPSF